MANILDLERRVLLSVTGCSIFGMLLMIISISTDYWAILIIPSGVYRNESKTYIVGHHSGLWRICRTEIDNSTSTIVKIKRCSMLKMYPSSSDIVTDPDIDGTILNYSRSETAFAVISLIMMTLGHVFAIYSLKEPRYMFKRLTAMLHFMTAICILLCAQVLIESINYERSHLPTRHPEGAYMTYGYSFVLAWLAFAMYAIATLGFLSCSRKRKRERAGSEYAARENEPVKLGRN